MGHKEFGRAVEAERKEGPSFTLYGVDYRCLPTAPGIALAEVVASATGNGPEQFRAILNLLDLVLEEESQKKLAEAMRSKNPDTLIDLDMLLEIARWLLGEYDNPNSRGPSGSPSGSATSGRGSTGGARPAVSAAP